MSPTSAETHPAQTELMRCVPTEQDTLLYRLLDRLGRAAGLDEIYEIAMDAVVDALGVARCSILLFDVDGVMRFRAWRGLTDTYRLAVEGHSPWAVGATDARPLVVPDVQDDSDMKAFAATFEAENIRALAFIPLRDDHALIGKFMVYDEQPRSFDEGELKLAETIGWQVANAVARCRAEAARDAARLAAEEANRTKDEFLAVISHELRTPLASITGWASLLQQQEQAKDPLFAKGLDVVARNAAAQARIIDDILDASRIVTGKLVIDRAVVDVAAIVESAVDSIRIAAQNKDVSLSLTWGAGRPRIPLMVLGDHERLRQVFSNVLANALKFTDPHGTIDVEVSRKAGFIAVRITDSGAGIAPEFLPHVFERFRQADSSRTRHHGGLGLGLSIVHHLVHLHGGTARADSEGLGKGATFTISLPSLVVASVDDEDASEQSARSSDLDLHGVHVLVIDDDADARELFGIGLERLGAEVTIEPSAAAGLAEISEARPDVVVSDLGMPGIDGYELLARLHDAHGDASPPVIALSAYTSPDDVDHTRRAGFAAHVAKPARFDVLARAIKSACRSASAASSGSAA